MLKRILFVSSLMAIVAISLHAKKGIKYYSTDDNITKKFYQMVKEELPKIGFLVTDPHKKINEAYKKKYGKTIFATLDFFPIVHEEKLKSLLEKEPRLAGFNPFDLYLYHKEGEKTSHVGHLTPETILDILKIEDKEVRKAYHAIFPSLDALLEKTVGKDITYIEYDALPKDTMMHFEVPFQRGGSLEDFIDNFQERFEAAFENKEYIIAGFENFKEAYEESDDKFAMYDAFWTYSLCHFKFSYTIFDNKGSRAKAGVFAPCTMYMYIKKGANTLVIGMPKLANWQAVNHIVDPKRVAFIKQLDKEIPDIMIKELGAREILSDTYIETIGKKERIKEIKTQIQALEIELKSLKRR